MARKATGQLIVKCRSGDVVYAARVRSNGRRHYVTLGRRSDGMSEAKARTELENVLADVRRGIWRRPEPEPAVVAPREEPSFHAFASEWLAMREREGLGARTVEHYRWALVNHLLPFFARHKLSEITVREVDRYKTGKAAEGVLSPSSVNKTLKTLAQIGDAAVEYGYVETNPARGKRRRLKAAKPRRTWLELDEVRSLLDAAGEHRTLLATMVLAGLRVGEVTELRWRDVDLAPGKLTVRRSKTDAGRREVDLSPDLLDELKLRKADSRDASGDSLVFGTRNGTPMHRANISNRILAKTIERANTHRAAIGLPPIHAGVTNHSLRRTFASLLYEAGASPAYVMSQMGHASSSLALEVYARKMQRTRDTGARMDALLREWAPMGTNPRTTDPAFPAEQTKTPPERGFSELRD
jgi:integrase